MARFKLRITKATVQRHPKLFVTLFAVGFLLVGSFIESVRAYYYVHDVTDYKNSASVLELHNSIQRFVKLAEDDRPDPILCELSIDNGIEYINAAYAADNKQDQLDTALIVVGEKVKRVIPSPRFSSMFVFSPFVSDARALSGDVQKSTEQILSLSTTNEQSRYCLAVIEVLREVYFVSDLRTPQGVLALSVGQIESFQAGVDRAQTKLRAVDVPPKFTSYHLALNEFLNKLRIDTRQDTDNVPAFVSVFGDNYDALNDVFADIGASTAELRKIPEQLLLNTAALE